MKEHLTYEQLRQRQYLVKRRLTLVKKLTSLKEYFKDSDDIILMGENSWTHPYQDYQALRYYQLLTCFDILGQPTDWKDYGAWLATKNNPERDLFIKQSEDQPFLEASKKLHNCYLERYGMKISFFKFINEVISPERREELLKSIIIKKVDKPSNTYIPYEPTEQEKLKFLLRIRNSYTHEGLTMGSPGGVIMPYGRDIEEDGIFDEGRQKFGEIEIHYEIKGNTVIRYCVRRWPQLLVEIIEEAL